MRLTKRKKEAFFIHSSYHLHLHQQPVGLEQSEAAVWKTPCRQYGWAQTRSDEPHLTVGRREKTTLQMSSQLERLTQGY